MTSTRSILVISLPSVCSSAVWVGVGDPPAARMAWLSAPIRSARGLIIKKPMPKTTMAVSEPTVKPNPGPEVTQIQAKLPEALQ